MSRQGCIPLLGILTVLLAIVICLCGGCAAQSPTIPTADSLTFVEATETQQSLAYSLLAEQKRCMAYDGGLAVSVQVMRGAFLCGSVWAAGCTYPGRVKVSGEAHVYENALAHEFIHVIELETGRADYAHVNDYWSRCDWRNR